MGGAHRRCADRHRDDAAAVPQGRGHDGQRRQQGGAGRDRDDQGRRAADGAQDHRRRDPGVRRRPACRTMSGWRALMPRSARCGSPTGRTRCTAGRSPGWSSRSIDERAADSTKRRSGAGSRPMSKGFAGPFELTQIPVGPVEPDLSDPRCVGRLCASPQAVRPAAALGARGRSRISPARRRFTRSTFPCRGRSRCATIRSVIGAIFYVMELAKGRSYAEWRAAGLRPAHAAPDVRAAGRHARRPPHDRSGQRRARRFRQARQLFRAAGRALDPAVSRLRRPTISRRWSG